MTLIRLLALPSLICFLILSGFAFSLRAYAQQQSPRVIAYIADVPNQHPLDEIWLMDIYSKQRHSVLQDEDMGGLAWSPDGRKVAFIQIIDHEQHLAVVGASGSGYQRLIKAPFDTPVWSPDGKWIATHSNTSFGEFTGLYIMRDDGSDLQQISANGFNAMWSADGESLYYLDIDPPGFSVNRIHIETAEIQNLHRIPFPFLENLSWSPNHEWFSYVTNNYDNRSIHLLNLADPSDVILASNTQAMFIVGWSSDGQQLIYREHEAAPLVFVDLDSNQQQERDLTFLSGQVLSHNDTSDLVFSGWTDNPARYELFRLDTNNRPYRLTDSIGHKWNLSWWGVGQ